MFMGENLFVSDTDITALNRSIDSDKEKALEKEGLINEPH